MNADIHAPRTRPVHHDVPLDAVLQFYAGVTDEMRSPLAALAGWVEVLAAAAGRDGDPGGEARSAARQALHRLRRLCDDAHDSAAVALGAVELHRRPVELAGLVAGVAASLARARLGPVEAAVVDGDPGRLAQILETLLRAADGEDAVEVALRRRGPWAELTVTHDRPVPFQALQGLFAAFSRPPAPDDDTVGLYVCRALVVAHGGDVGVASEGGRTTVWVDLPLAAPGAGPEAPPA